MLFCKGAFFSLEQTQDAKTSWTKATDMAPDACVVQLVRLAQRLADRGALRSPDQFNDEGDGFWAIKARCGLRAYGWFHSTKRGVFVISHFIVKKKPKLALKDKERMKSNKHAYESQS